MLRLSVAVVIACIAARPSLAATLYVDAAAACPGLGTQADPYCTIQGAIDASAHGDTVLVAPGTYAESITFAGKRILVQSTGGAAATTIDATAAGARAVRMQSGETRDSVIDGFTVTGGANGGFIITGGAAPTVRNCVITGNSAVFSSGMSVEGSSAIVQACSFVMNSTTNGPGGALRDAFGSTSVFEDCLFESNTVTSSGAAIESSSSLTTVRRCEFRSNNAGIYGGGIHFVLTTGVVEDCVFDDNVANPALGNGSGGGIRSFGGSITVRRSTFTNNRARQGNAVEHEGNGVSVYEDCLFEGNNGGLAGGAAAFFASPTTIDRCVFRGNQTDGSGGGVYTFNTAASIRNSLFVGNTSAGFGGGAIFVSGTAAPTVVNCTIVGNSNTRGGGLWAEGAGAQPVVANSIVRGNTGSIAAQAGGRNGGAVTIFSSNVQGGWAAPGGANIDADPMFVDAMNGDYSIPSGSPCVDAGDNSRVPAGVTLDLARGPRFFDDPSTADTGVGAAPVVDIGAYEFSIPVPPCPADLDGDGLVNSSDLAALLGSWGSAGPADLDGSGAAGSADLAILLGSWGACVR